MSQFEIEVKSLLRSKEELEEVKKKMHELDPDCALTSKNTQLTHYFEGCGGPECFAAVQHLFSAEQQQELQAVLSRSADLTIRTRQKNEKVMLIVKAPIHDGDSVNAVRRIEFEQIVDLSLDELDQLLLDAGFTYQAKWSREREEYEYKGSSVCIDKNAGFGYIVEIEKVVPDEEMTERVHNDLYELMRELDIVELAQDRLARMFEHYKTNWPEYYGTDKVFVIE